MVRKKFFFEYWAVGDVSCGGQEKWGWRMFQKLYCSLILKYERRKSALELSSLSSFINKYHTIDITQSYSNFTVSLAKLDLLVVMYFLLINVVMCLIK